MQSDTRGQGTSQPSGVIGGLVALVVAGLVAREVVDSVASETAAFETAAADLGETCLGWMGCGDPLFEALVATPPGEVFEFLVVSIGIGLALPAAILAAQRWWRRTPYALTDIGHRWGVSVEERSSPEPCIVCGQADAGEARWFRRDHVLFGVPLGRHRAGVNHYCEACVDEPGRRDRVEGWPVGHGAPSGRPSWRARAREVAGALAGIAVTTVVVSGLVTVAVAVPGGLPLMGALVAMAWLVPYAPRRL